MEVAPIQVTYGGPTCPKRNIRINTQSTIEASLTISLPEIRNGRIEMINRKRTLAVVALVFFALSVGCSREVEKEYYPNGKLKSVLNYKKGQLEGIALYYYENGELKERVNYRKGKRERTGTTYYESGKLKEEITYENGMRVNVKLHGEDGALISESVYKDDKLVEEKK